MAKHRTTEPAGTTKPDDGFGYDYVHAKVRGEGSDGVDLQYQVTGLRTPGRDRIDDDVTQWSDADIQKIACDLLGIDQKFASRIDVRWG